MTSLVLYRIEDDDLIDGIRRSAGTGYTFRLWDDAVAPANDTASALNAADALLIDESSIDPHPVSVQLSRHRLDLPLVVVTGEQGYGRDRPAGKLGFQPRGNAICVPRKDPCVIVAKITEQINLARRRAALRATVRRELDTLAVPRPSALPKHRIVDSLWEFAPVGIVLTDDAGVIGFANPCSGSLLETTGAAPGSEIGTLLPPNDGETLMQAIRAGSTPAGKPLELALRSASGTKYVSVQVVPLADHGDDATRLLIFDDRTSLVEARIEAEAATRSKSELLASMSHELRTPLNAILGFSEIMKSGMFGDLDERYAQYCGDIYLSAEHLLDVINDMLDLAKIEADRFEPEMAPTRLGHLLRECLKFVAVSAERKGLSIGYEGPGGGPDLVTDPRLMRQIVINLLTNAVKYTPEGGKVRLVAEEGNGGWMHVRVIDTGIGIAEEDLPHILEPFGQARRSRNVAQEGTGLGLPLSKKLGELLGCSLSIASEPGRGTEVTLRVPLRPSAP